MKRQPFRQCHVLIYLFSGRYDRKDSSVVAISLSPEASLLLGFQRSSFPLFKPFDFLGVHSIDFSGVRDDKCHVGVGQSRVRSIKPYYVIYILNMFTDQVKPIKLTTCPEGEFTCNDGQCIDMEQR